MFELPINITTQSGDVYGITNKGDYRMVLDCFNALNDTELSEDERVLASLLIFYNDIEQNISSLLFLRFYKQSGKNKHQCFAYLYRISQSNV